MDKEIILIVDDDEMMRLLLTETLQHSDYDLITAENGAQALALFSTHKPSLVLLDVDMPGISGFEVCRQLRSNADHKEIPIVMVTGMDNTDAIEQAYKLGATDFLVKPINWSLIPHHIRYVLRAARHTQSLEKSERMLAEAQEIASLGHWEYHVQDDLLVLSKQLQNLLTLTDQDTSSNLNTLIELTHSESKAEVKIGLLKTLKQGTQFGLDHRLVKPTGEVIYVHQQARRLTESGNIISGTIQDISERKRNEVELIESKEHYANLFQSSAVAMVEQNWLPAKKELDKLTDQHDPDLQDYFEQHPEEVSRLAGMIGIVQVNRAALSLHQVEHQQELIQYLDTLWGAPEYPLVKACLLDIANGAKQLLEEGVVKTRTGSGKVVLMSAIWPENQENYHKVIINYHDMTELKYSQQELVHIAHHDALTGLPNRVLFQDRLESAIARVKRNHHILALLFLDLDRFKNVNDSLGHEVGDELLCEVAKRISTITRASDTTARLGGDEFTIILEEDSGYHAVEIFAKRLIKEFEHPFYLKHRVVYIGVSIGISLYPDHGLTPDELTRNADTAMYKAKQVELSRYELYCAELTQATIRKWSIENELRKSIAREEFYLLYQPKINPHNGRLAGVEALIRWHRPLNDRGLPSEFIPIAEETGQIIALGQWVIDTAITQLANWRFTSCHHVPMAINVSGGQLRDVNFTTTLASKLSAANISPTMLEMEITENYLIPANNEGNSQGMLQELADMGIKMSIDDFGTGYSSLSQLKSLPISSLKIDQSFVRDVPTDMENVAIVKSIISLAKNLGLQVIAEGVETQQQLSFIKECGCDLVQGYFYSKPVSAASIVELANKLGVDSGSEPQRVYGL